MVRVLGRNIGQVEEEEWRDLGGGMNKTWVTQSVKVKVGQSLERAVSVSCYYITNNLQMSILFWLLLINLTNYPKM